MIIPKNIDNLVLSDRRLSIRMIAESARIDEESIRTEILHNNFNMQKVCAKMMTKILTFEQTRNLQKCF